jgi:hypothetical protein
MDAAGARPFTGGNAESLAGAAARPGSGAGNALCAKLCPAWAITTATVSGAIKRRMIKAVSPARSIGPHIFSIYVFSIEERFRQRCLRFLPALNNPWNLATARR